MKLVTVSGPIGAGKDELIRRLREAFFGDLSYVERNGFPLDVIQETLDSHPRVIIEATPAEVCRLHLTAGPRDAMFRIFVFAPLEERRRRLREMLRECGHEAALQSLLRNDPVSPQPPRLLHQPVFDLIICNGKGRVEAVSLRVILAVGRFLGVPPSIIQI